MKKNKQSGFSLIEVLIGMGIMGVAIATMMNLTDQSNKNLSNMAERFDETELISEIRSILADPESCVLSLSNLNALNTPEGAITNLKEKMGTQVISRFSSNASGSSPGYGLRSKKILGYSLQSSVLPPSPPADAIGFDPLSTNGSANFKVRFERKSKEPYTINIRLRVKSLSTSNRNIVECSYAGSQGVTAEDICASMKGMIWNSTEMKCVNKPVTCRGFWEGPDDRSKWTGFKETRCPNNCYVKNVLLGQERHDGGDWDSNSVRVECCCPDMY